jgi:hypothetical protein
MFDVLKIDGAHITTNLGNVILQPASYADGGQSKPVSSVDLMRMVRAFAAIPKLLDVCQRVIAECDDTYDDPNDMAAEWKRILDDAREAEGDATSGPIAWDNLDQQTIELLAGHGNTAKIRAEAARRLTEEGVSQ